MATATTIHDWQRTARRQAGVLSRAQALHGGLSAAAWRHALESGRWSPLLPGVAVLHTGPATAEQRAWAAVLYSGRGAALGGRSALCAAGLELDPGVVVHVAIPGERTVVPQPSADWRRRGRLRLEGSPPWSAEEPALRVAPHRVADLSALLARGSGPARTRPAVAVVHAVAWARSAAQAELLLAVSVQQRLVTPSAIREASARMPVLPRAALLREVVDDLERGVQAAGELAFVRLLRRAGLPPPSRLQRRVRVGTAVHYLDAGWDEPRVDVEIDGAHHRSVRSWEADLLRSNGVQLARAGAVLLRFTTGQLRHEPDRVLAQLRTALGR